MPLLRRKGLFENSRVLFLPIAAISPNPDQPRRHFSKEGLEELAASIREHGVLQPLSVRRAPAGDMSSSPGSGGCGRPGWPGSPRSPASAWR